MILLPFVIIILAITLIFIPISIAAVVIFVLGLLFGWIAIGYELGIRMSKLFKSEWAPAVSAGLGTFTLSIVSALISVIPCVGWIIPFLVTLIATGGVVISVFGTRGPDKPFGIPRVTVSYPDKPAEPTVSQSNIVNDEPTVTIDTIFASDNPDAPDANVNSAGQDKSMKVKDEKAAKESSPESTETENKPKARTRKAKSDTDAKSGSKTG